MIKQVNNFSGKSFKDYSGPANNFNQKNIIFGYNGKGKSSLAIGIVNEFEKVGLRKNARIFNDKYVKDNIIMEDDNEKIRGVVANFGEKAVGIERSIKEIQKQIITDNSINELTELIGNTRKNIDNIHDKRKGIAKISRKNSSFTLEQVLESYKNDLIKAELLNINHEELEKTKGDNTLAKELDLLRNLNIGTINEFKRSDEWEIVLDILVYSYKRMEMPSQEIITWLNDGLSLHKEESECQFCSSTMNYQSIKEKVERYNSNELQKAMNLLTSYKKELNKYVVDTSRFIEKKDHVFSILPGNEIKEHYINIEKLNSDLIEIDVILAGKINNMNETVNLKTVKLNNLTIILKKIKSHENAIKEILSNKQDDLQNLITNQDQLVKGAIALEIEKDSIIKENLAKIKEKRKISAEITSQNEKLYKQIEELHIAKSTVSDFANLLTQVLENLGIDIEILLDDSKKNYILQHSKSEETLTVEDISEGEKSLLSLLFFYYELFEDDEQIKFKDNVDIVVIDDPISSLDGANRYYVLEVIKTLLSQNGAQIFVLTHVWDDFSDLCYGKDKDFHSFFEVYKNNRGESNVREKKPHASPYKMLFQEVYSFSEKDRGEELNHCEVYHLPNSMRKVFEEFLSFKSSKNIIPTQSTQPAIENIMNITSKTQKQKLAKLLTISNILSHKASYNPEEILESAKFLMSIIKKEDEKHYYAMRGTN